MAQALPWPALSALIDPHHPKPGRPGRQPYSLATMLRIHFLQQWYALSDPGYRVSVEHGFVLLGKPELGQLCPTPKN